MKTLSENTVITLGNSIELAASIITEVAGEEVSDTVNGAKLSEAALHEIIASQINKNLSFNYKQGNK